MERVPSPMPLPSKSRPIALVNSPLPSERNSTLPLAPAAFDQASSTKGSFTATQATVCTPFFLKASALSRKPGRCLRWQVGVKAPGTANSTTFLPAKTSDVLNFSMPSDPSTRKVASGRRSPLPILMVTSGRLSLEFRGDHTGLSGEGQGSFIGAGQYYSTVTLASRAPSSDTKVSVSGLPLIAAASA